MILRVTDTGRYYFGDEQEGFGLEELEIRLQAALTASPRKAIQLRIYSGSGPEMGLANAAQNTAGKVGFLKASGIEGYTDDHSRVAQMK